MEQMRQEIDKATFHPLTNEPQLQRQQNTEDRLIRYGLIAKEKKAHMKRIQDEQKMSEFDFRP
jgi:hypothetical protein